MVAFVLNTSAYSSEIIRGAINGLPQGEVEAAKAYGMSPMTAYRRIILPNALRRALPAYSNEVIFMLHGSAVAGIITIMDLTGAARLVNSRYYAPFESFLTAGLFYMCLTFIIIWCFKKAETKFLAYLKPLS
jgi:arginine/ornithine transport system permease protein